MPSGPVPAPGVPASSADPENVVTTRAVLAAIAGNFLEFFDFISYAYFASYIGKTFFPSTNPLTSLLLAFVTFGIGFLMRPIGAIVIGLYADTKGRRPALVLTILLMAGGTFMVGIMPGYADLGLLAPLLIVVARSMQGFSAGGEWGGASSFLVEYAPPGRRGFFGSLQASSVNAGLLCGTLSGVILNATLTPDQVGSWGWRVPFLVGGLIGPIGLYVRAKVAETPAFERARLAARVRPVSMPRLLRSNAPRILTTFGITVCFTITAFTYQVYLPTFLVRELKFPLNDALLSTSISLAISVVTIPLAGALSDLIGRKPLMLGAAIGLGLSAYPLFWILLHYPAFGTAVAVQIVAILLYSAYDGPFPAAFCELFPTHVRVSGISIGYNVALAIFGGFTPFVVTSLIAVTGMAIVPAFYLIAASIVSSVVLLRTPESFRTGSFDEGPARDDPGTGFVIEASVLGDGLVVDRRDAG